MCVYGAGLFLCLCGGLQAVVELSQRVWQTVVQFVSIPTAPEIGAGFTPTRHPPRHSFVHFSCIW